VKRSPAIVHFSPLEQYPPAQNLIRILCAISGLSVEVHTTQDNHGRCQDFGETCRVYRNSNPAGKPPLRRLLAYLGFYWMTFLRLLSGSPSAIVYIEPSSAFPVYLYSLLRPGVPIFLHHHEYHSPDQFLRPGMRLIRAFHWLEKRRLFRRARWVSHTNAKRLELFAADCPMVPDSVQRILPNYPPGEWRKVENRAWLTVSRPFRFVYVGSLSLRDTFLAEFVGWLLRQPAGRVCFDVYAYNLDDETREFLLARQGDVLRHFPEGVAYENLPEVLADYHAGVILYKAETLNYRYNETNKLFEYLICGLDVWYSHRMEGIRPHARQDMRPRVIECDFEKMDSRDWSSLLDRSVTLPDAPPVYTAESACAPLVAALSAASADRA
jgi:glycosyltransferase involved in cell wall biosynthesis